MKTMKQFLFPLCFITLISCNKSETPPQPPAVVYKLKSAVYSSGVTRTYEYNNDGSLKKDSGSDGYYSEYSYTAGNVLQQYYLPGSIPSALYTYVLNAEGLAGSFSASPNPQAQFFYEYNTSRQPVLYTANINGNVTFRRYYTYQSGNMVRDSTYLYSNGTSDVNVYEYYTDKTSTVESPNYGLGFFGQGNKNNVKKITTYKNGVQQRTADYSYVYDAQGRLVKTNAVYTGTPVMPPLTIDFTYY